jgi:hypothetical protein
MNTIGEVVSRVRGSVRAYDLDSFITDRYIYSVITKYAKLYIKQNTGQGFNTKFNSLFTRIPCMDLITVDKIEACCDVQSGCTLKRTKDKIPGVLEGPQGPLMRSVTSIDGSSDVYRTTPQLYNSIGKTSSFKYNTNKYYWIINNYIYLGNVPWDSISIEGIFEGNINSFLCDNECAFAQDQEFNIPPDLFAQVEQMVIQEIAQSQQINPDPAPADNQSPLRR